MFAGSHGRRDKRVSERNGHFYMIFRNCLFASCTHLFSDQWLICAIFVLTQAVFGPDVWGIVRRSSPPPNKMWGKGQDSG